VRVKNNWSDTQRAEGKNGKEAGDEGAVVWERGMVQRGSRRLALPGFIGEASVGLGEQKRLRLDGLVKYLVRDGGLGCAFPCDLK